MSEVGKVIKKITFKPDSIPVPPKETPAPTPVEEPVHEPA